MFCKVCAVVGAIMLAIEIVGGLAMLAYKPMIEINWSVHR